MPPPIAKAPKIWFEFCLSFHQDFGFRHLSFDDELRHMLSSMNAKDLSALKTFLIELIESDMTDGQLSKLFAKGGSDLIVKSRQKQPMRGFFTHILELANEDQKLTP